jgi:hypothetical protein
MCIQRGAEMTDEQKLETASRCGGLFLYDIKSTKIYHSKI